MIHSQYIVRMAILNMERKFKYNTLFPNDQAKATAFDRLADRYYKGNFGTIAKSDLDVLMFSLYIDRLIEQNRRPDGTLDYTACSDYNISKDLGITQQKVRNLKIKKQLLEPEEFEWQRALASLLENAHYDESTHKVTLNIPDPNLYLEIQNFIEEKGAYIEKTLNNKMLQLRAEYFIQLLVEAEPDKKIQKDIYEHIKKHTKQEQKDESKLQYKSLGKFLCDHEDDIKSLIEGISTLVLPENVVWNCFCKLIT